MAYVLFRLNDLQKLFPKYRLAKGAKVIAYANFSVACLTRLYREFRVVQDSGDELGNRILRSRVGIFPTQIFDIMIQQRWGNRNFNLCGLFHPILRANIFALQHCSLTATATAS